MKTTMKRIGMMMLVLIAVAGCMTACGDDDNVVVIEPAGSQSSSGTPAPTEPYVMNEVGRMNASHLLTIQSSSMVWNDVSGFEHTEEVAGTAVFPVTCGENLEGTLTVVYDAASGAVSSADMTLNDVTVSLLVDDWSALAPIMDEMRAGASE